VGRLWAQRRLRRRRFRCGSRQHHRALGWKQARKLHALAYEAVERIQERIRRYGIACEPINSHAGLVDSAMRRLRASAPLARYARNRAGVPPRERVRETLITRRYHDALLYPHAFHFHPLNYALGVATAVEASGGRIFESSEVTELQADGAEKRVRTAKGLVKARTVVMACGGYIDGLHPKLSGAVRPIATWVMVTEPLDERLRKPCVAPPVIDSRFDFDYYRPLPDTRILWAASPPQERSGEAARLLLRKLLTVYPQLRGA
jgi:glycine/D-amino acid oxidase-like deaminating enzyme